MTKSEYMNALREKLQHYNRALEMEILEDYEQHFAEGLAEGRREEDIIAELGNIDDMLKEFSEEDLKQELEIMESQANQSNNYEQLYRAVVIEGLLADVEITASADDRIRIDYDNCGSKAQKMRYQFYQYERDGVFYAGVKERKGPDRHEDSAPESIWDVLSVFNQFAGWSGGDIHLNVQIPAGLPAIEIDNTSGDLRIRGIQTQKLETQCISGDLRIEDVDCKKFFGKTQSGDVEVSGIAMQLDEDTEIEIQTTSGNLAARRISAAKVYLHTSSGDVSTDRLEAGLLKVQTASGEQELVNIACDRADLRSGSGDIDAVNIRGRELNAAAGSGEVELQTDMEAVEVKTGSGDIELAASARTNNIHMIAGSGDINLDLSWIEGASIASRTGSGDMSIRGYEVSGRMFNSSYGNGACQVSLTTGSGDIVVK